MLSRQISPVGMLFPLSRPDGFGVVLSYHAVHQRLLVSIMTNSVFSVTSVLQQL